MDCTIKINMDNAAFDDDTSIELGRILSDLEREVRNIGLRKNDTERSITRLVIPAHDTNGNLVGGLEVREK